MLAGTGDDTTVLLILDPSELFGVNLMVTIYYANRLEQAGDAIIEQLIGVGRVSNVQQNGLIQIRVLSEVGAHAELWRRVRSREVGTITQIVVRPSVPYDDAGMEVRFNG
jgi:hypothetical protein